jgi:hypothetical protein
MKRRPRGTLRETDARAPEQRGKGKSWPLERFALGAHVIAGGQRGQVKGHAPEGLIVQLADGSSRAYRLEDVAPWGEA